MRINQAARAALKIKVVSLAAEIALIHREEIKMRALGRHPYKIVSAAKRQATSVYKEGRTAASVVKAAERRLAWVTANPTAFEEQAREGQAAMWHLRRHRYELKREFRMALLAYGAARGRPYYQIERQTNDPPDFMEIRRTVERFLSAAGCRGQELLDAHAMISAWINDAQAYIKDGPKLKLGADGAQTATGLGAK